MVYTLKVKNCPKVSNATANQAPHCIVGTLNPCLPAAPINASDHI